MSEFNLATASVTVQADTRPFRNDFQAALREARKQQVQVVVKPDTRRFLGALRSEVFTAASKVTASVKVVPNMRGFQTALQRQVATAAGKVSAAVSVTPAGRPGQAAAAGAGGGAQRAAAATRAAITAEQQLTTAINASSFARKKLTADMTVEEKRLEFLRREQIALAEAEKAVTFATKEQNKELLEQAIAQERAARAAVEKRQGTIARETEKAARPARREADEQQRAQEALVAQRRLGAEMAKDTEARLAQEAKAAKELSRLQAQAIVDDRKRTTAAQKESDKRAKAAQQELQKKRAAFAAELQAAQAAGRARIETRARAQAAATERLADAQRKAAGASQDLVRATRFVSDESDKTAKARAELSRASDTVTRAERTFASTIGTNNRVLQANSAATLRAARNLEFQRSAALQTAVAEDKLTASTARRQSAAARGFGAQLATFAGLRGAVLAANASFIAGTVGAIAFGKAVQSAANLESELNVFRVTAQATAEQMSQVAAEAERLGADMTLPGVSAADAASAFTNLAKAGLTVEDSLGGARGVLQLATAAQIDNAQATELTASALNAFSLSGEDAVRVADTLANAANLAQGSITDVAIAMQQASAVARLTGVSFEDTIAMLALLQRAGIRGSDAGTSLRVALTRLIAPTDEAAAVLKKLNIQVRDAAGNVRPEVFAEIAAAQSDLSRAQQDANAKIIFGVDALRAYSIIARGGVDAINSTRAALSKQGTAAELANARMAGLTGQVANLKNQLQTLGLSIGRLTVGPLSALAEILANAASETDKLLDRLGKIPDVLPGAGGGGGEGDQGGFQGFIEEQGKNLLKWSTISLPAIINLGLDSAEKAIDDFRGTNVAPDTLPLQELVRVLAIGEGAAFAFAGGLKGVEAAFRKNIGPRRETEQGIKSLARAFEEVAPQIARALEDGIITPAEQTMLATTELGRALQRALKNTDFRADTSALKANLEDARAAIQTSTADLVDQARAGVANLGPAIHSGIEDASRAAVAAARNLGTATETALVDSIKLAFFRAVAQTRRSAKELEDEMNRAIIAGASPQQRIAILKKEFQNQQRVIDAAQARLADIPQADQSKAAKRARQRARDERSDALAEQARITGEITSEQEGITREREQRAQEIAKANDEADQALLDSFLPSQRKLSRQEIVAAGDEALQNDISVAQARKRQLLREIKIIDNGFKDRKQAAALIAERRDEIVRLDQQMEKDKTEILLSGTSAETFQINLGLAQAEGNFRKQIQLIDGRIKQINDLIAKKRLEKDAVQRLRTEEANLRVQREQVQDEQLQAQTDLAQSIFDLTGNKNPLLRAINAQIAETRKDIAAAKKAGRSTVQFQTELNKFLLQRKEVLNDLKDQKQGTTAFDILRESAETFQRTGGNLITGNQPFSGATGFTADIAQWLQRQRTSARGTATALTPAPGKTKFEINDDRLVRSLDRLANAIESNGAGSGNASTATKKKDVRVGELLRNDRRFWDAAESRNLTEG